MIFHKKTGAKAKFYGSESLAVEARKRIGKYLKF